uniref:Ejaculatory bulb-specific protein 3-like protein n=1 Tax=Triatoma infestans TaxID=30076 RepID=A0A161M764_TRIIF
MLFAAFATLSLQSVRQDVFQLFTVRCTFSFVGQAVVVLLV